MPTNVVDIDLSAATGSTPVPTYNDVMVIGHSDVAPEQGWGTVQTYSSAVRVAEDHGDGSDIHIASQALDEKGVEQWRVTILREQTANNEVVGGDEEAASKGTTSNAPIHDDLGSINVSVDGSDVDAVIPKTQTPPDADESPEEGEAFINTDTGEVVVGSESAGGSNGIEVSYTYLDWLTAETEMQPLGIDLFVMADTRMRREHIGNLDRVVSYAGAQGGIVVAAHMDGDNAASDRAAMDVAHDIGQYVPSGDLLTVAHKSGADVGAYVTGQLATNEPWFDPFWDGDGYPFDTDLYRKDLIGEPGEPETFEGGDENEQGPTNVIISVNGTLVMSNSLTTVGNASNYQFVDISRTESFIANETRDALRGLRLRADSIPFTSFGRSLIMGALRGRLNQYAGRQGQPLSNIEIDVPEVHELSSNQRANRQWGGISITGTLAGNVHTFGVDLNLQV